MKIFKWIVIVALVLVIVMGVIVYMNLNGLVERTVEKQATASLNLQTTLGGVSLSLFGGSLGMDDLEIASPQGFSAPRMFSMNDAAVKVRFGELRQDPVRISSINLKG